MLKGTALGGLRTTALVMDQPRSGGLVRALLQGSSPPGSGVGEGPVVLHQLIKNKAWPKLGKTKASY